MSNEIVAQDSWGQIIFYGEWNSLELKWLSSTATATDANLRSTIELFADEAVNRKPDTLIVDANEFHNQFGDGMMEWRDANIIPKYNASGAKKFAFIASPDFPGPTVESGTDPAPDGPASFPTGWFKTRERAYEWLGS